MHILGISIRGPSEFSRAILHSARPTYGRDECRSVLLVENVGYFQKSLIEIIMDSGGILGSVWIGRAVDWFCCLEEQRRWAFIVRPDKIKPTQKADQTKRDSAWRGEKWWHRWLRRGVNKVLTLTGTLHPDRARQSPPPPPPTPPQPPCEETQWPCNPYAPP